MHTKMMIKMKKTQQMLNMLAKVGKSWQVGTMTSASKQRRTGPVLAYLYYTLCRPDGAKKADESSRVSGNS